MSIPEMRRKDRVLSQEESLNLLNNSDMGVLSTVSEDGQCYGVPVNYAVSENAIYIHGLVNGFKSDNIEFNNNVSFTVIGEHQVIPERFTTLYESVIVFGKATIVSSDDEKLKALNALCERFSKDFLQESKTVIERDFPRTMIIKIYIEKITGKTNKKNKKI